MNIFDEIISKTNRDNYPGDYDMGFSLAESISILAKLVKDLNINVDLYKNDIDKKEEMLKRIDNEIITINNKIRDIIDSKTIKEHSITLSKLGYDVIDYINKYIKNSFKEITSEIVTFEISKDFDLYVTYPDSWEKVNFSCESDIIYLDY